MRLGLGLHVSRRPVVLRVACLIHPQGHVGLGGYVRSRCSLPVQLSTDSHTCMDGLVSRVPGVEINTGRSFYRRRINHDEPSGQSNPGSIAGPFLGRDYQCRTTIDLRKVMSVETDGSGLEKRREARANTYR